MFTHLNPPFHILQRVIFFLIQNTALSLSTNFLHSFRVHLIFSLHLSLFFHHFKNDHYIIPECTLKITFGELSLSPSPNFFICKPKGILLLSSCLHLRDVTNINKVIFERAQDFFRWKMLPSIKYYYNISDRITFWIGKYKWESLEKKHTNGLSEMRKRKIN